MNARLAVRKLLAFDAGKPLPKGTTLHFPKRAAKDTLVLAFVRSRGTLLRQCREGSVDIALAAGDYNTEV